MLISAGEAFHDRTWLLMHNTNMAAGGFGMGTSVAKEPAAFEAGLAAAVSGFCAATVSGAGTKVSQGLLQLDKRMWMWGKKPNHSIGNGEVDSLILSGSTVFCQ
jgi:hypothetical protein